MVDTYKVHCEECNAEFTVQYGSRNKNVVYETYSCPKCHNLFSLSNIRHDFSCPNCGNAHLQRYNMNKDENKEFYTRMYQKGLLAKDRYSDLIEFWDTVKSDECPKCGKHSLEWKQVRTMY